MAKAIMAASAVAPGTGHARALALIAAGMSDPVLGPISMDDVQLCPQHAGRLSEELVDSLMATHPVTQFRLHATPRIAGKHVHTIVEAVDAFNHPEQMVATAALSRRMGAKGYSIHAGQTALGTLDQAFENIRRLSDLFGCRVGIEGLYPSLGRTSRWLLATWEEHERMLEAGIDFAIDLSHIHIIAKRQRTMRMDLVRDMVSSPRCMEVHVSDNDGRADSHRPLTAGAAPWWLAVLGNVHPDADLFYEGVVVDPRRKALHN